MISKTKLKELAAYKQQKRCDEEDLFVVEGTKMCDEALRSRWKICAICATERWISQHSSLPVEVEEVNQEALERLSHAKSPNEVWMLVERAQADTFGSMSSMPLTLVLDKIQDPGNMGTIIRTADWFGIRKLVCSRDTVSCYNPKVVQSTMGGIFRTQVVYTDLVEYLKACSLPVYGAVLDGKDVFDAAWTREAVLVIGNESRGISPEVQELITHRVAIPNLGGTCESLNASVATAILCAEYCRMSR